MGSLDSFKRNYIGSIHNIWSKLPQEFIIQGAKVGWCKITTKCKKFLRDPELYEEKVAKRRLLVDEGETRFKN